ncbi:nnp-1 protein putative nuclear protein 1 nop52 [Anaeramoeba flamelloides]|uniref:Nnp-1 protein putative nuclear protein 1 nop52 n=1 Tax=Anaeramoeba flamelloides TaxID=1746091 RepID=A0ABQ8X1F4_9EUKA|nr:nnp-1 protein putative nuclear protein 1 nop52 [Anaeramoeba flamelloides]
MSVKFKVIVHIETNKMVVPVRHPESATIDQLLTTIRERNYFIKKKLIDLTNSSGECLLKEDYVGNVAHSGDSLYCVFKETVCHSSSSLQNQQSNSHNDHNQQKKKGEKEKSHSQYGACLPNPKQKMQSKLDVTPLKLKPRKQKAPEKVTMEQLLRRSKEYDRKIEYDSESEIEAENNPNTIWDSNHGNKRKIEANKSDYEYFSQLDSESELEENPKYRIRSNFYDAVQLKNDKFVSKIQMKKTHCRRKNKSFLSSDIDILDTYTDLISEIDQYNNESNSEDQNNSNLQTLKDKYKSRINSTQTHDINGSKIKKNSKSQKKGVFEESSLSKSEQENVNINEDKGSKRGEKINNNIVSNLRIDFPISNKILSEKILMTQDQNEKIFKQKTKNNKLEYTNENGLNSEESLLRFTKRNNKKEISEKIYKMENVNINNKKMDNNLKEGDNYKKRNKNIQENKQHKLLIIDLEDENKRILQNEKRELEKLKYELLLDESGSDFEDHKLEDQLETEELYDKIIYTNVDDVNDDDINDDDIFDISDDKEEEETKQVYDKIIYTNLEDDDNDDSEDMYNMYEEEKEEEEEDDDEEQEEENFEESNEIRENKIITKENEKKRKNRDNKKFIVFIKSKNKNPPTKTQLYISSTTITIIDKNKNMIQNPIDTCIFQIHKTRKKIAKINFEEKNLIIEFQSAKDCMKFNKIYYYRKYQINNLKDNHHSSVFETCENASSPKIFRSNTKIEIEFNRKKGEELNLPKKQDSGDGEDSYKAHLWQKPQQEEKDHDLKKMKLFKISIVDMYNSHLKTVYLHIGHGRLRIVDAWDRVNKNIITKCRFYYERKPQVLVIGETEYRIKFFKKREMKEFIKLMKLEKSKPIPKSKNDLKNQIEKYKIEIENFNVDIYDKESELLGKGTLSIKNFHVYLKNPRGRDYQDHISNVSLSKSNKYPNIGRINFKGLNLSFFIIFSNLNLKNKFSKLLKCELELTKKQKYDISIIGKPPIKNTKGEIITNKGKILINTDQISYVSKLELVKLERHTTQKKLARIIINNAVLSVSFPSLIKITNFTALVKKSHKLKKKNEKYQLNTNISILENTSDVLIHGKIKITENKINIIREDQKRIISKIERTFLKVDPENHLEFSLFFTDSHSKIIILFDNEENSKNIQNIIPVLPTKHIKKIVRKLKKKMIK